MDVPDSIVGLCKFCCDFGCPVVTAILCDDEFKYTCWKKIGEGLKRGHHRLFDAVLLIICREDNTDLQAAQ
jgi:hypothetical protein